MSMLLRLVYRLLFLMVAEERRLIDATGPETMPDIPDSPDTPDTPDTAPWLDQAVVTASGAFLPVAHDDALRLYYDHYSVGRFRRMAEHRDARSNTYHDLWIALNTTFDLLEGSDEQGARALGIAPLDGDLFSANTLRDLSNTRLRNNDLLVALYHLSLYYDQESRQLRRVNYGALDVEELGSVYESLLDYRPVVEGSGTYSMQFKLVPGTERKTTGSYYTNPNLVQALLTSTLDPVLDARLRAPDPEAALLAIRVCDPACGSGHFLLAAARRIGQALARVRSGENQPAPSQFRRAVRDVITHCIYGVDLNPLAIDLCKLALWIEGHNAGLPLSFLNSHIRVGNSLVGATASLVAQGVPDDAFKPVRGDDKATATALRKRNRQERSDHAAGQTQMDLEITDTSTVTTLADGIRHLETISDTTVATVRDKASRYDRLRDQARAQFVCYDLWCAAFFQMHTRNNPTPITTRTVLDHQRTPLPFDHPTALAAQQLATAPELCFFHWELEFPHVFQPTTGTPPGFDVVLGNPPWERIKLQEQEHFVDVPAIRDAPNKAARERCITAWRTSDDATQRARIAEFDRARHRAEATSRFVRVSGRFPLTAVGDMNTYALFAEQDRGLIHSQGRAGLIVPTGIATDNTTRAFFADLNQHHQLVSLYDFENREGIFPGVHRSYRFSLMTMGHTTEPARLLFFATRTDHLEDARRRFTLTPKEVALINPNTHTSPTFRTRDDADLTKHIYRRVPVLVNERTGANPWGVSFLRMLDMSNDSHLFHTAPGEGLVPLYEAKLLHQFTHRWATYNGNDARDCTPDELADPSFAPTPRYWVARDEVDARLAGKWERAWLIVFRGIARSTDERSSIFGLLPFVGAGNSAPVLLASN